MVISAALSSRSEINLEKFERYAGETKDLLFRLYPDSKLTPTIHKTLEHSAQVIHHYDIPIGMLTEEALEARHKECRLYRLSNTRKMSQEETILDLFDVLRVVRSSGDQSSARALNAKNKRIEYPILNWMIC